MGEDEFTTPELLTLVLAAWGALLSTGLALRQIMHDRRRVKVIVTPLFSIRGKDAVPLWAVRVVNVRKRPVEIRTVGLTEPDAKRLHAESVDVGSGERRNVLPATLEDGESVELFFPAPESHEPSIKGAWARDTLNREHIGRYPPLTPRARWRAWRARRRWQIHMQQRASE